MESNKLNNNILNNFNLKNLLQLSTITELTIFTKQKKKRMEIKRKKIIT